jgi:FtsP/CotA-like multicopper oxidase with cupredoxin domain
MESVELVINDLKFQQNGSIYYHDRARVARYNSWIPGYYGDAMIVNGKSWPFFNA